ncbi:AMP-binding protein [Sulfurimonas sp. HSL3-7]|uniref:AMP-binding protein n=1 Tax=Sulfonitrofixus jiaomeiensis TaxID=3131938 RepID=UPI0031F8D966
MNIIYINNDGERTDRELEHMQVEQTIAATGEATFDAHTKPELFALLHKAIDQGVTPVLFDKKIESITERVSELGIKPYSEKSDESVLPLTAYALFFTSGTTGVPTGAIKNRENIQGELDALQAIFEPEHFERVIVTVPFIHIYGFLSGLMLPKRLGCEVLLKEEYYPQELISLHEGKKTLVVTSPVYIKAMLRLKREHDLNNVTFLSSTGLLVEDEVARFEQQYNTTLLQIFGSTETGGVAIKRGVDTYWQPLQGVLISKNFESRMVVDSPYLSTHLFEETITLMKRPYTTSDIIELEDKRFRLLGRANEIVKVSGKRISIVELENLIENGLGTGDVLIGIKSDIEKLKDESLDIKISGRKMPTEADVRALFKAHYPEINFSFELTNVKNIEKNSMGKKVRR